MRMLMGYNTMAGVEETSRPARQPFRSLTMKRTIGILLIACLAGAAIAPGAASATPDADGLRPKRPKDKRPEARPKQKEKRPRSEDVVVIYPPPPVSGVVVINEHYRDYSYLWTSYQPTLEDANLGLTLTAMIANATFVIAGQTQEVVAGFGVGFGLTSLLFAARPGSQYRAFDFVVGTASLVLAYLNLQASNSPTGRFTDLSQSTSRVGAQSRSVGVFSISF